MQADTVVPCVCRSAWICLEVDLRFFIHHSNNPLLQSLINFSFSSTSREVGYSAMGCKPLDDIERSGHRNIKISGDGLVALRLCMLFHNFGSQILRLLFALLSILLAQYGTHRHTTQRLSQLFSILTGCNCDLYITNTCYLLLRQKMQSVIAQKPTHVTSGVFAQLAQISS